jgi:arylformamidase
VEDAAMAAHRALGGGGVPIVENLDLSAAEPGDYDLLALPVRLTEAEAAPVRAVLLPPGTLRGLR